MTQSPCPKCGVMVSFNILQPQIVNAFAVSLIIVEHGPVQICHGCLSKVLMTVTGIQGMGLKLELIQEPEEKKLIHLPGSSLEH